MTVYVVQNHLRYDSERGLLVPRYDISSAQQFGRFDFLLQPRATIQDSETVVQRMDFALRDFSDDDYLLLIGNPVFIGWATAIAAAYNEGRVNLLMWSGKEKGYREVKAILPVTHASL